MKKFWLIGVALFTVFLVACTNDSTDTSLPEQNPVSSADTKDSKEQQEEKEYMTLYRADADAQYVEAYVSEVLVTDDEAKRIQAIFDEVTGSYEIRLLNYRMEDAGETLVLNMGEGLTKVQGTAGEFLFIGSLLNSFFENFPKVETIKLEENGSAASLGHMGTLEPFTRADAATYVATADTKEEEYVTLYRADADAQYVEAYVSTVKATDDEAKLIETIFTEVVGDYKISLLDYRLEDNGETLVLNMGNGLENVQGTAGEFLFVGSVLNSFFENFPKVETITLEQNGAAASLGHMGKLEPFTKADAVTYINPTASAEEAYLTLYRADADAQYVEAYESTVKATDDEAKLIETIFTEVVAGTNLSLANYHLDNNGTTLVLNMSGSLEKVQGAAGESMFIGTLLNSFFENFPQVATIKLEVNGQVASFSHMGTIESFSRADAITYRNQ